MEDKDKVTPTEKAEELNDDALENVTGGMGEKFAPELLEIRIPIPE